MNKWVVFLGVEVFEGFIGTDKVVLVKNEEQAEKLMYDYLNENPEKRVVGFKIDEEAMRDA